jgi:hypothetical protein
MGVQGAKPPAGGSGASPENLLLLCTSKPDRGGCPEGGRSHHRRLMQENRYAMAQENIAGELEEGED